MALPAESSIPYGPYRFDRKPAFPFRYGKADQSARSRERADMLFDRFNRRDSIRLGALGAAALLGAAAQAAPHAVAATAVNPT
ncbi:MAG TPA: hypothetical protein VEA60_14360, partial [Allosphingosinicella sp.]|nr:hypothetical protein [Allosphingosinicella sp.]